MFNIQTSNADQNISTGLLDPSEPDSASGLVQVWTWTGPKEEDGVADGEEDPGEIQRSPLLLFVTMLCIYLADLRLEQRRANDG